MEFPEYIAENHFILDNPVSFKLSVAKRSLDARFVSATFEPSLGYILKITFSDGHEDQYQFDEGGLFTASGKVDQYCKALQKEIDGPLGCWTSKKRVYTINYSVNGKDTNVWMTSNRNDYFSVYHLNEFRFYIKKENGKWYTSVPEAYGEVEIDKDLLNKVTKALNYYTAQ